jgi:hypothetical protein
MCCPVTGSRESGGAELRAVCPLEVFRCWRAGEIGAGVSEEDDLKHSGAGAASRALPVR